MLKAVYRKLRFVHMLSILHKTIEYFCWNYYTVICTKNKTAEKILFIFKSSSFTYVLIFFPRKKKSITQYWKT